METKQVLGGLSVDCICSRKPHNLASINDLFYCNFIINFLKHKNEKISCFENLKKLIYNSRFSLEEFRYRSAKHYDEMKINIDLRGEILIQNIRSKVKELRNVVDQHQNTAECEFETIKTLHEEDSNALDSAFHMLDMHEHLTIEQNTIEDFFIRKFNRIQSRLESVSKNKFYFFEKEIEICKQKT